MHYPKDFRSFMIIKLPFLEFITFGSLYFSGPVFINYLTLSRKRPPYFVGERFVVFRFNIQN